MDGFSGRSRVGTWGRWFSARGRASALTAWLLGPIIVAGFLAAGCTLIGYSLGAKADGQKSGPVTVDGWAIERIAKGTKLEVLLRDESEIKGVFRGLSFEPNEYRARYEAWSQTRSAAGMQVPPLYSELGFETREGKQAQAAFLGFEIASLAVREGTSKELLHLQYERVVRVSDASGRSWKGEELGWLASAGRLPMRSQLLIDERSVPMEQVSRVVQLHGGHQGSSGRILGTVVGALLDLVVIGAVAVATDSGSSNSTPTYGSCPFVYAHDGRDYVEEGDVFPGAVFHATQRADRLVLKHARPVDGTYRVRVKNDLQEIDHIDDIRLVVVDGPEGALTVPASRGRVAAIRDPIPPSRATDLDGVNVLAELRQADGRSWVGNPLARAPQRPADFHEGVVLEFARPRAARSVSLVFRAKPTAWASRLLQEVFALQGPELAAWSDRIETDAVARAAFLRAYQREGKLALSVWTGDAWRSAGFVDVHEAAEIALADIPGDVLRVRLESTSGLWSVDSVHAGYDTMLADVMEIPASLARTSQGEDVGRTLASADQRAHALEPGDAVDLTFPAPPLVPGRQRTVMLEAAGYYSLLVQARPKADPAAFAKLLDEPGAFGRFGAQVLRADLAGRPELAAALDAIPDTGDPQ